MGMRERQVLRRVELPVALPVILGGRPVGGRPGRRDGDPRRRSSAAAGLGRYLVEGIAQSDDGMLFGGVVLVAGLALADRARLRARSSALLVSPGLRGRRRAADRGDRRTGVTAT